jgi:hypothetical protein
MTKFVIGPDVALLLAEQRAKFHPHHKLLAPTLLRSQVLAQLYGDVQTGTLARREADLGLDYLRGLAIRLLGDRVLQRVAGEMAEALSWHDTFVAEYLALTRPQADALVLRDPKLRQMVATVVPVAAPEALLL